MVISHKSFHTDHNKNRSLMVHGEFLNGLFSFLDKKYSCIRGGFKFDCTGPYLCDQNDVVSQKNKVIMGEF